MNQEASKNTLDAVLTKQQFDRIFSCLADLAAKLRLMAVLLVDGSGRILAQKMGEGWKDSRLEGLAALASGSFSASNEIARLLGERDKFKMVLHEGQQRNIFMCSVGANFFLAVVFESGTALGMIRLFTRKTVEELIPVLADDSYSARDLGRIFDKRFETLLDDEMDKAFADKQ